MARFFVIFFAAVVLGFSGRAQAQLSKLELIPDARSVALRVKATVSDDGIGGKVRVTLRVSSANGGTASYPKPVSETISLPPKRNPKPYSITLKNWESVPLWFLNLPYRTDYRANLHRLTLTVTRGSKMLQKFEREFAFSDMKMNERGFFLNGEPAPLRLHTLTETENPTAETVAYYLRRGITILKAKAKPFSPPVLRLFRQGGIMAMQPDGTLDVGGTTFKPKTLPTETVLASVEPLTHDLKTGGNWLGNYGKLAFFVAIPDGASTFALPGLTIGREQTDFRVFGDGKPLGNVHLLQSAPGSNLRYPIAFTGTGGPVSFVVRSGDSETRVLSLYLLDFLQRDDKLTLRFSDTAGVTLHEEEASHFENGLYLRVKFAGEIRVEVIAQEGKAPTVWGLFIDRV